MKFRIAIEEIISDYFEPEAQTAEDAMRIAKDKRNNYKRTTQLQSNGLLEN